MLRPTRGRRRSDRARAALRVPSGAGPVGVARSGVACAIVAIVVLLIVGAPAAVAGGAVSVTPGPIVPSPDVKSYTVTVRWEGLTPGKAVYLAQCRTPQADAFDFGRECSTVSEVVVNPAQNATGAGSSPFPIFYGPEPTTDWTWGCWSPGQTPEAGYAWHNPADKSCYIRATTDTEANNADAVSTRLVYEAPSAAGCNVCTQPAASGGAGQGAAAGSAAGASGVGGAGGAGGAASPTTAAAAPAPVAAPASVPPRSVPPKRNAALGSLGDVAAATSRSPWLLVLVFPLLAALGAMVEVMTRRRRARRTNPLSG